MKIIIPAYQPDERMIQLIEQIKQNNGYDILLVDDGSGEECHSLFEQARGLGCTVLTHPANRGKGAALKTAFTYLLENQCQDGLICADCDGQHTWKDIRRIAEALPDHPASILLGSRQFVGKVPLKSRFGNALTRLVFTCISGGNKIPDTQTGLRGYHAALLPWLISLDGNRYEYEMNQLLSAKKAGYGFYCIPIDTIYENKNKGSHFQPIRDSIRVYLPIVKFSASSLLCGLIDFLLLFLLKGISDNLLFSVILARVISSLCNYLLNKHLVFAAKEGRKAFSLLQYYALAALILTCNYLLLSFLNEIAGIPLFYSKLLTEILLFALSYTVQRKIIFKNKSIT